MSDLRQRMPAEARRHQLLEVALERFATGGYHHTSMDQIAEAAGVTKPVLYQHFKSKHQLYRQLLDSVGDELLDQVSAAAAAQSTPHQMVLAGFRAYFDFVSRRTSAFRLLFGTGARVTEDSAESVRRLEERMAAAIARLIDVEIDEDHRELLGHAIVGLGEVAARRWVDAHRAGLGPEEAELFAVRLSELVWAGLRGLPGSSARRGGEV